MPHRRRSAWLPTWWDVVLLAVIMIVGLLLDRPGFKKEAPWLVSLQMHAHSLLTRLSPLGAKAPEKVSVVEIDDATFWYPPLSGVQPTNRAFLAEIVNAAADAGARVIALDFQLKSPIGVPTDDPSRAADDRKLIEAVMAAGDVHHIPVVLTGGLVFDGERWHREPNICDDRDKRPLFFSDPKVNPLERGASPSAGSMHPETVPQEFCDGFSQADSVALGYINLPADRRQVPLQFDADEYDGTADQEFSSFALQVVSAYEARLDYESRHGGAAGPPAPGGTSPGALPANYKAALDVSGRQDFVYASFIPPAGFESYVIRARDLVAARQSPTWQVSPERGQLSGRIVMIGATWHEWGQGRGPLVDEYPSPVGPLAGVYFHANYVEAILGNHFAEPLSRVFSRVIEVIAGYLLIVLMHWRRRTWERLLVWVGGVLLLSALALFFSFLGWYLDYVLVSLLLLVHVIAEHYEDLRQRARQGGY